MDNVEYIVNKDLDATLAVGVTRWYMDYSKKTLTATYLDDDDSLPFDKIDADKRVFLMGMVPSAVHMKRLLDTAGDVVWICNRMDEVEALYADPDIGSAVHDIKGKRAGDRSLCELTWDAYFEWMGNRPKFVNLVGRFTMGDVNYPEYEERVVPFCVGLGVDTPDPFDDTAFEDLYKKVLCLRRVPELEEEFVQSYIAKGREILSQGE